MSPTRTFSLCLVVGLSLAALFVSQAQATPKWMTPLTGEPAEPAEVSGKVEKALVLVTKVGLSKVEIICEGLTLEDGLLEVEGKGSATGSFTGCLTWLNGNEKPAAACTPHSPSAAAGTIVTSPLVGSLKSHTLEGGAKESLLELKPETGSTFVALEMGATCAIGSKFSVTGTFFARDSGGGLEVEAETHLLEGSTALGGVLFGANKATLDGAVRLDLVELGLWSGLGE